MAEVQKLAHLSACGTYRLYLARIWDRVAPRMLWVMLNPSTADAEKDDATIRICMGRARRMGFGSIHVVNLFALRSTQPSALYEHPDPVGPNNDEFVRIAAGHAQMVICAWGTHGKLKGRGPETIARLKGWGVIPYALRLNEDGSPAHPLRIPYSQTPFAL